MFINTSLIIQTYPQKIGLRYPHNPSPEQKYRTTRHSGSGDDGRMHVHMIVQLTQRHHANVRPYVNTPPAP